MRALLRFLCLLTLLVLLAAGRSAPADEPGSPRFYRGINLNGPAITIDGHAWEGNDAPAFRCDGNSFENQGVKLQPAVDAERAKMIRASRWGRNINVEVLNAPPGVYQVFLYVWEDNDSTTYSVKVNDRTVLTNYASGPGGTWKKLGPWRTQPRDGVIRINATGGDANLSGLEIWAGEGDVPSPLALAFNTQPTPDELAFFESKIRPLLINRCYDCHSQDASEVGGNLLLDSHKGIIKGGDTEPPVVPGDANASLLIKAVRGNNPDLKMPPDDPLTPAEVADLERWVAMRAPDPRLDDTVAALKAKTAIDWDKARDFWSLRPLAAPSVPKVNDEAWPTSDVDRFILAKQEAAGLHPAEDADKLALLRRVTFDLIGLPPTPEEIAAFVGDASPGAFANVVERLLASPHYGERWGRHWLDVVRYSDTAGDNSDFPVPQMYLYRNWVIDAFNRDLPYNEFVRAQLAGDLMPSTSPEQQRERVIATGYIANSRRFGSRVDDYPWHLTIEDTIDNVGRTFLATTVNCARCHNHKFDPITNEDYYALYGIFHSTQYPWPGIELEQKQRDLIVLASNEEIARVSREREAKRKTLEVEVRRIDNALKQAAEDAKAALQKQLDEARERVTKFAAEPLPYDMIYGVADKPEGENVAIQTKGDPTKPGDVVERHFLSVLGGQKLAADDASSGRLALADWIVDPKNPLTARVMANRIWLHHFGKAIVPTPNDFGRQGKPPTHPELLDYLATKFIASGWSIKALHREIVLSRTYRQASRRDPKAIEADPANDLLSSYPRRRLDAESIRDALLFVSGQLDETPGKAHPFPPMSDWKYTQHNPFKAIYETNRRSVYLMTQRIQRHPYLAIFDGADPSISVGLRMTSTTPLQALYLLNDAFVHEQARALAQRLTSLDLKDSTAIEQLYVRLFGRAPTPDEVAAADGFHAAVREKLRAAGVAEDQLESQAQQALIRALIRLNEFVYLD